MPDMSDPLDMMRSRVENLKYSAKRLRADAAVLIARAEQTEEIAFNIEGDLRDLDRWMPVAARLAAEASGNEENGDG